MSVISRFRCHNILQSVNGWEAQMTVQLDIVERMCVQNSHSLREMVCMCDVCDVMCVCVCVCVCAREGQVCVCVCVCTGVARMCWLFF